ncbi:MAG TPA: hypothetical protein VN326_01710 [Casimicrobiaceae bacterium]|nr:hypothetical protein [Casimicrobiaceae bacterium]
MSIGTSSRAAIFAAAGEVREKNEMRFRKEILVMIQGAICNACTLTPQVDELARQDGAKRAFVQKRFDSVQEIDLKANPCFANLPEDAFARGKVFEVRYWIGKIMWYLPAYSDAAVELKAGDAVELWPPYCSNGKYPRITRKMTPKEN